MKVFVTARDGQKAEIIVEPGDSLMMPLRDAGLVDAICGGQAACATCHVYIHPEWIDRVGLPAGQEADLLESSLERSATSRLSCQVKLDKLLNDMKIIIAPSEG